MSSKQGSEPSAFDKRYYDRFYGRNGPRRKHREQTAKLVGFVSAYLAYIGLPIRSVLDLGCGLGLWGEAIAARFPNVRYRGVEFSPYLCRLYGWEQGSVVDYHARQPFDLVVCQDTLQYLSDADADTAIRNLARLSRGALYFSVLTRGDWKQNADRTKTDADVHKRTAKWYRARLGRSFMNLGGGLFLKRDASPVLWELERLD